MANWQDRIRDIGHDLINIEINTIEARAMTGRKMPVYPHALIDIAQKYADFLVGPPVCLKLDEFTDTFLENVHPQLNSNDKSECLTKMAKKVDDNNNQNSDEYNLSSEEKLKPLFEKSTPHYTFHLTNGWPTFELLRCAARSILTDTDEAGNAPPDAQRPEISEETRAILIRIARNCDQLKSVTRDLGSPPNKYIGVNRQALLGLSKPPDRTSAAPNQLALIRKAWDIGTDRIVLQTVVQLDGDVIFRASPGISETHAELLDAHRSVTQVGLGHWHKLFNLVLRLLGNAFEILFDRRG